MSKRIISLLFVFSLLLSCCGFVLADTDPVSDTKLRLSSTVNTNYVLNVYTDGTPELDDQVRMWVWDNNGTQWWKTCQYMTYGGIPAFILPLYSYPTLMLNDYHPQSGHYCTLYTSTNNYYTDICFYWEKPGNYYQLYLFGHGRYLDADDTYNGAYCYWSEEPYGTNSYQRWAVTEP